MALHFCQMRIIGDGIRLDQQPPATDCCGKPAHDNIIVWGRKQWACRECYDEHVSWRGVLHYDGEGLDASGKP
jgi:hypothetical protein